MNETRPVRPGEELDPDALGEWITERLGITGPIIVSQFPAGHSNLTYLVEMGGRELVLRRPPIGVHVKSGHDMRREYRILDRLHPVWHRTPSPVAMCEDETVIGAPFYLMTRVHGTILRSTSPVPTPDTMRRICVAFVETFAEIHGIDFTGAGLAPLGRPAGYVERQVGGWSRRWRDSAIAPVPAIDATIEWLVANQPAESGAAVIHNDFKFDNLVLDPRDLGQVKAVLDWEMATLGDPLMDLGSSLAYWAEAGDPPDMRDIAGGPTTAPGAATRSEIVDDYADVTGVDPGDMVFYYAFGLFRLAVIAQQIYYRYHHGLTSDQRFASFGAGAQALGEAAQQVILSREI
jgi:aminoglycoside phosphotransferase (APT) family kinase protein